MALTALAVGSVQSAKAQDATWQLNPGTGDFNTAANWTPAAVPTGTASFGTSNTNTLSFSSDTTFSGWTFNAGASTYTFNNSRVLSFTGAGIDIQGGSARINSTNVVNFYNAGTAGNARFQVDSAGSLNFYDTSTAANAIIGLGGASANMIIFNNASTAGDARFPASAAAPKSCSGTPARPALPTS